MRRGTEIRHARTLGMLPPRAARNAIIIPGAMAAEARGSIGGVVFSRNKGGQYAKSRSAPTNPQSTRQTFVRNNLATLISDWNNRLTSDDRESWVDFAAQNPQLNSLGQSIFLTGLNWWVKLGSLRLLGGLILIDIAPPVGSLPPPDPTISLDNFLFGSQTFDFIFDDTQPWASQSGAAMFVFMGKPQSPGTAHFDIPYRLAETLPGDVTVPLTSPQTIIAPWSFQVSGENMTCKATISLISGATIADMQTPYLLTP